MRGDPSSAGSVLGAGAVANVPPAQHSAHRHASSSTAWRFLLDLGGLVVTPDVVVQRVALALCLCNGLRRGGCGTAGQFVCGNRYNARTARAQGQQEATA